jgi:hypothetical protein
MIIPSRRRFFIGAAALLAAPAFVKASNLHDLDAERL